MKTAGEYRKETERILMGDEKRPDYGYRPRDIREKVKQLLLIKDNTFHLEGVISTMKDKIKELTK